jgi:uncharacterized protein (TIGR02611 family)
VSRLAAARTVVVVVVTKPEKNGPVAQVRSVRARVRASPAGRIAWRVGVSVAGVAIIVVGIVLLPLPGPGWLIIFAGLGLLATEYEWAARLLRYARRTLSRWTAWVADRHRAVQALIGLAGLVLLGALIAAAWWYYRR